MASPEPEETCGEYRGWLVELNWLGEWEATHPDFDPTPLHLDDGPSDNRHVAAREWDDLKEAVDEWILEHGA
jgi:hypothetical protein